MERKFSLFAFGIFLISVAALCFEVALSYEFAFMFWFNVSIVVISIAMFGLGIGGVAGYFMSKKAPGKYFDILYFSSIAFGLTIIASIALISHGSRLVFESQEKSILYFSLSSALPFVFSGVVLSMGLNYPSKDKKVISFIYFSDLVGAGIGAFLITALLPFSTLEGVVILCALLAVLSAPLFCPSPKRGIGVLSVALVLLLASSSLEPYLMPEPDREKFLYRLKSEGASILDTRWTSVSRVDVVEYADKSQIRFIVNGNFPVTVAYGNVSDYGIVTDTRYFMFFNAPKSMLAIGSGGGWEMLLALYAGVEEITAVEINPFIVEYMKNDLHEYSNGIYHNPKVETFIEDGRTLVHRTTKRFDLIENGVIGSNGLVVPSSSLLNFQDAYVYTVEANKDYWEHMTPKGTTVTILWAPLDDHNVIDRERGISYYLVRQYLTVKQALLEEGEDPQKHLMMFIQDVEEDETSQAEYTFIFKEELTPGKVENWIEEAKKYGLKCVYAPFFEGSYDLDGVAEALPKGRDVSPVYDDKPFFYYTEASSPLELKIMLKVLAALTLLFIIIPVVIERRFKFESNASPILVLYFLCLGVGYILIEAVLIQKLTLFLGRPAYAFQVVLFSMLVFSGLGSFFNGIVVRQKRLLRDTYLILILTVSGILLYSLFLGRMVEGLMHLEILEKVMLSIGVLAPLSFIMGMPFPSGLRITSSLSENDIAWMYGVNGAGSVMGSIIGMIIAFNYGFSYSLIGGGVIYLLALAALWGVKT
jgi:hypothetical protein